MAEFPVPDIPETETLGAHGLGPHVVGQRVVVRRVLRGERGPTGGPAFTDQLGVCLAWADGWCVVQPESGDPVRIAVADIVSGKPVPPRPAVRHRVGPREAQLRGTALFPDVVTEPVGDWLLRTCPGETARRANSVLAFGPPGPEVEPAYDRVVAHYRATTGRPIAAVLPGSDEEALFLSRGWVAESSDADTVFQIAGVARALRAARRSVVGRAPVVELAETPAVARAPVVELAETPLVRATIHLDGTEAASGVAAYAEDWVGFRSIVVDPAYRRRGLAVAVMAELLAWGAELGATTAYLQVLGDNEPALALYERLGFRDHHRYRYLAPDD
ncbi:GNAT family N-acetyltransferase [Nocardioides ferulae]|uniref:GNAT family N-acetyltransferase n=1 Tax=Nocardioides ferulae TaxID=2340821 RepID=UPI000EB52FFB|nr:GNAT family N-acetyltransferase [Nocardioides ferulae]